MELFNATCGSDEVIIIEGARYGRMNIGRCVRGNYGYHGCAVDVHRFMDGLCSGRHVCQFNVPDPVLYDMQPCPADFTSYLEATYSCIPVSIASHIGSCDPRHPLRIQHAQAGYISSALAEDPRSLGTSGCPWIIEARPGQRINVTMLAFKWGGGGGLTTWRGGSAQVSSPTSATDYGPVRPGVCFEVAILTDGDSRKLATVCGGDERETGVLVTKSHVLSIEITNPKLSKNIGAFLFKYQVLGCRDLKLGADAYQLRTGETLMVRCNASGQTWYLTCRGTDWIGEAGNCSNTAGTGVDTWTLEQMWNADDGFPFGVLLAVAIGVAMGIAMGGVLLCLITTHMKAHRRRQQGYAHPPPRGDKDRTVIPHLEMVVDHSSSSVPYPSRANVELTMLPLPTDYWHTEEPYRQDFNDGDSDVGNPWNRASPYRMTSLQLHPDVAVGSRPGITETRIAEESLGGGGSPRSSIRLDCNRIESAGFASYNIFASPDGERNYNRVDSQDGGSYLRQQGHSGTSCVSSFRLKVPPLYECPPH